MHPSRRPGNRSNLPHLALYRKYRSQTFEDLVGQEHITKTLQAAIESGRVAHAYLFVGPRGTGKTSAARILAKCLNCEKGPTPQPCGECRLCVAITRSSGGDVLEMDAASEAGIDEVRENIIKTARYAPMEGRYKVFIIDEVHDLSSKAFDALLKTIEEPPPHVVFVLATTEFPKVPLTIRSRCQRYEFHRGSVRDLLTRLEYVCRCEGIEAEAEALGAIARMADGSYRDALTLLEQAVLTESGRLTHEAVVRQLGLVDEGRVDRMLESAAAGDVRSLIETADEAVRMGKEPRAILESLLLRLSELTHAAYEADTLDAADPGRRAANHALAARIGRSELLRFRAVLGEAHKEVRDVTLPRVWLELALLRLAAFPEVPRSENRNAQTQMVSSAPKSAGTPSESVSESPEVVEGAPAPKKRRPEGASEVAKNVAGPAPKAAPKESDRVASASTDVPQVEELRLKWDKTVANLIEKHKSAGKMLDGAELVGCGEGKTAVVAFSKRFQFERVEKGKNASEAIVLAFRETMGDAGWRIRFELRESDSQERQSAAVQSLVEGEQLASLVEEVFEVRPE